MKKPGFKDIVPDWFVANYVNDKSIKNEWGYDYPNLLQMVPVIQVNPNVSINAQLYNDAVQYKERIEAMLRFPKPIIAAVNGPAVAGGAGLVLASSAAKSPRCSLVLSGSWGKSLENSGNIYEFLYYAAGIRF